MKFIFVRGKLLIRLYLYRCRIRKMIFRKVAYSLLDHLKYVKKMKRNVEKDVGDFVSNGKSIMTI